MSKLDEMRQAIQVFCDREYSSDKKPMTGKCFTLFAVDGGGYDITNDVTLAIDGDVITLTVHTALDDSYNPLEMKKFQLQVKE